MKKYSFVWITGVLFVVTLIAHWWLGWYAFVDEQAMHGQGPEMSGYLIEMGRDTMENWQSEFLQLAWQVAGLAFLYYAGSPASRGDDDRMEAKLDLLLRRIAPEEADAFIRDCDKAWPGREEGAPSPNFG